MEDNYSKEEIFNLRLDNIHRNKNWDLSKYMIKVVAALKLWFQNVLNIQYDDPHDLFIFHAYIFPDAKDFESTLLLAKWSVILFMVDDEGEKLVSNTNKWFQLFQNITNGKICKNDLTGLEKGLFLIWEEIKQYQTPAQHKRFNTSILTYFNTFIIGHQLRRSPLKQNLKEYLEFRYFDACTEVFRGLIEYKIDCEVMDEAYEDPDVKKFLKLSSDIWTTDNDMYSIRKEFNDGDCNINSVFVTKKMNNCSFQEAVDFLISKTSEDFKELIKCKNRIIERKVDIPILFLIGVDKLLFGTEYWTRVSKRYK